MGVGMLTLKRVRYASRTCGLKLLVAVEDCRGMLEAGGRYKTMEEQERMISLRA